MIITGILLEVLAAALGTTSKQLIAYSEYSQKPWIFHLGASMNILVGPIVDASAYAFAPQVVVAPFACLDVIFNALTAPYTLHWQNEHLTSVHIAGTTLVALGAVFTAVFGSVTDVVLDVYQLEAQLLRPASIAYYTAELCAIFGIAICLKAQLLSAPVRGICLGVIAGVLMGNVFCMKGFIGIVRLSIAHGDGRAWHRPTPYILIAMAAGGAIAGHIFMRMGLGEYKGIFMVTIFEGAHITAACLSGCIVMSEMAHAPWWQYVLYWLSVSVIVAGMVLINTAAENSKLGKSFHIAQSFSDDETQQIKMSNSYGAHCDEKNTGTRHRFHQTRPERELVRVDNYPKEATQAFRDSLTPCGHFPRSSNRKAKTEDGKPVAECVLASDDVILEIASTSTNCPKDESLDAENEELLNFVDHTESNIIIDRVPIVID